MTPAASFPNREIVASKFAGASEADWSYLALLMENAAQDDSLIDGLHRYLDLAAAAPFLNSLKLEIPECGLVKPRRRGFRSV